MATKALSRTRRVNRSYLRHAIEAYRRVGITHFQLLGGGGGRDCTACRSLLGRTFTVAAPPALPPVDCACQPHGGHLCTIAAGRFE